MFVPSSQQIWLHFVHSTPAGQGCLTANLTTTAQPSCSHSWSAFITRRSRFESFIHTSSTLEFRDKSVSPKTNRAWNLVPKWKLKPFKSTLSLFLNSFQKLVPKHEPNEVYDSVSCRNCLCSRIACIFGFMVRFSAKSLDIHISFFESSTQRWSAWICARVRLTSCDLFWVSFQSPIFYIMKL